MAHDFGRVLVTGGAGLIGLHVCAELVKRGIEPHLLDLPEQIRFVEADIPDGTTVYYGSILDQSSLRDAMKECQAVIHLAAYLGVRRTETNRLRCIEINVNGVQNVLDCALQDGVRKFVFASSSEVYGEPLENPVTEATPTQGKSVYAVSKMAGEELIKAYAQRFPDLRYAILRYFNTFGPYQVAQFVIPKFVRNAMEGKPPVVYGSGAQKRSYLYAGEAAWASVEALVSERSDNEVINVGNSRNLVSLRELADIVIRLCDREGELTPDIREDFGRTDRRREREVFERFCEPAKAKELLGFSPKVTLEEGIKKIIEHGIIRPKWATSDIEYTLDDWV